jgi:ankyrin repeat protein
VSLDPAPSTADVVEQLRHACATGDVVLLADLIARDASPEQLLDAIGTTPLMAAATTEIVDALLAAGACTAHTRFGRDVLDVVVSDHESAIDDPAVRLVVARRLLEHGMSLDRRDANGWSRLYVAAFADDPGAVEALLALGAAPDDHPAPLAAACWGTSAAPDGAGRVIDLLVAGGADISHRDGAGFTLLHAAAMPYGHGSGFESSDGPNPDAMRALVRHGLPVDSTGPGGVTALMLVAGDGDLAAVDVLLAAGANPRLRDHEGRTAFDHARDAERRLSEMLDDLAPTAVDTPADALGRRQARAGRCAARLAIG